MMWPEQKVYNLEVAVRLTDMNSFEKNLSFEGAINLYFEALYRKKRPDF